MDLLGTLVPEYYLTLSNNSYKARTRKNEPLHLLLVFIFFLSFGFVSSPEPLWWRATGKFLRKLINAFGQNLNNDCTKDLNKSRLKALMKASVN